MLLMDQILGIWHAFKHGTPSRAYWLSWPSYPQTLWKHCLITGQSLQLVGSEIVQGKHKTLNVIMTLVLDSQNLIKAWNFPQKLSG